MQNQPDINDSLNHVIKEITEVAEYLWQKGWAERNSGNISVRISDTIIPEILSPASPGIFNLEERFSALAGDLFLVTGAGCRMRDVCNDPGNNLLLIRILSGGDRYEILSTHSETIRDLHPTSELYSHLMIHQYLKKYKPTRKAIVHTHPSELIALSHSPVYKNEKKLNRTLWGMLPETVILVPDGIGVVPYQATGSRELAHASIDALKDHDVLLWEKHGCLAVAPDVIEAFDLIDILVKSADILFKCLHAGYEPEGLTDDKLNQLRQLFKLP